MSKSLQNNFGGSKGCCGSKSLLNFNGRTLSVTSDDRTIEQYLNSLPVPLGNNQDSLIPGPNLVSGDDNDRDNVFGNDFQESISANNITIIDLIQSSNISVLNTLNIGNGSLEINNSNISSPNNIEFTADNINFNTNNLITFNDDTTFLIGD